MICKDGNTPAVGILGGLCSVLSKGGNSEVDYIWLFCEKEDEIIGYAVWKICLFTNCNVQITVLVAKVGSLSSSGP